MNFYQIDIVPWQVVENLSARARVTLEDPERIVWRKDHCCVAAGSLSDGQSISEFGGRLSWLFHAENAEHDNDFRQKNRALFAGFSTFRQENMTF